jgi:hypothetical protein
MVSSLCSWRKDPQKYIVGELNLCGEQVGSEVLVEKFVIRSVKNYFHIFWVVHL